MEAASIHGGKDQEERNEAIKLYKEGLKGSANDAVQFESTILDHH